MNLQYITILKYFIFAFSVIIYLEIMKIKTKLLKFNINFLFILTIIL